MKVHPHAPSKGVLPFVFEYEDQMQGYSLYLLAVLNLLAVGGGRTPTAGRKEHLGRFENISHAWGANCVVMPAGYYRNRSVHPHAVTNGAVPFIEGDNQMQG